MSSVVLFWGVIIVGMYLYLERKARDIVADATAKEIEKLNAIQPKCIIRRERLFTYDVLIIDGSVILSHYKTTIPFRMLTA